VTASRLVLHASETRVEITCPAECADALRAVWAPAGRPIIATTRVTSWNAMEDASGWTIYVDGVPTRMGRPTEPLAPAIEDLFVERLPEWHVGRCLLHAALVEVAGNWVVFVGVSGAGKSSLTLEAVRRGGKFFTDEIVVTDGRRVWGVGRSTVFDVGPVIAELPPRLAAADRVSYRFRNSAGQVFARPIIPVPDQQWATSPVDASGVVIVRVRGQGRDGVDPLRGAEALATLLEASIGDKWHDLGRLVSARRAFALTWSDPRVALDHLTSATSHLANNLPREAR
jgi:hypothetical protein